MKKYDRELTAEEVARLTDKDIDFSDIPELDDNFWKNAKRVEPDLTEQVTLRLKRSTLGFFKASGKGYQTRINQVLESYIHSHSQQKNLEH